MGRYPGVYKTGDGKIFIVMDLGKDEITHKRHQKKAWVDKDNKHFTSLKQAAMERQRIMSLVEEDKEKISDGDITYSEFLQKKFLPIYKSDVRKSTYSSKIYAFKKIEKYFANYKLKNIDYESIDQFKASLLEEYSIGYARLIFDTFKSTLWKAYNYGLIEDNVISRVKGIKKVNKTVNIWNKDQFEKVLSQIWLKDDYQYLIYTYLVLFFMTGIRVGEGLALYWDNIDFKKKTIFIGYNLEMKNKKLWIRHNYTKTNSSPRTISVDDNTLNILKEWNKRQNESKFVLSFDGNPMVKSTLNRAIKRYSKLAGVHSITPKGLRHSHASYLINDLNEDVLVVSKRLGHSNPNITLNTYSHLWNGRSREIPDMMSNSFHLESSNQNKVHFSGNQFVK